MSNHFSADYLKSPGDDRRLDITDVFLFKSSKDPSKLVLIMDSNPTVPDPAPNPDRGPEFYPGAVYRINIDTDGDAHADAAFTLTFSDYQDGNQTGTAWYATGDQARQPEPAGERLTTSLPVSFDGTVQPLQAGPARCSPGGAATRSSPTSRAPCTTSSGPGKTTSPATTCPPSHSRSPPICSAPAGRSASGPPSAGAATTAP